MAQSDFKEHKVRARSSKDAGARSSSRGSDKSPGRRKSKSEAGITYRPIRDMDAPTLASVCSFKPWKRRKAPKQALRISFVMGSSTGGIARPGVWRTKRH